MKFPFRPQRRILVAGALCALPAALIGCSPEAGGGKPLPFKGSDITGSGLGKDLDMIDGDGHERTLADFKGKVLLIYFGYTQCPDVCPTSMAQAALAIEQLGDKARDVQVILISVDPDRDTPPIIKAYAQLFDPDFIGLTGTPEQLRKTAQSFKAFYAKEPGPSPDQYAMNHSSTFYLMDRDGQARALVRADSPPEDIAHDIELLL